MTWDVSKMSLEDPERFKRRDSTSTASRLSNRRQILSRGREEPSVQVSLYKVQHGTLNNGRPASIIVTDFQFESTGRSRIETAAINYTFTPKQRPTSAPTEKAKPGTRPNRYDRNDDNSHYGYGYDDGEDYNEPALLLVREIAPSGYASIELEQKVAALSLSTRAPPTSVPVQGGFSAGYAASNKYDVERDNVSAGRSAVAGNAGSRYRENDTAMARKAAAPSFQTMSPRASVPVEVDVSAGYATSNKYVVERDNVSAEQSTVAGTVRSRYREKDTARWMLTENENEERGVPNYLRAAVLVERGDRDAEFVAKIEVSITLGGMSNARKAFGSSPDDDATTFRPGGSLSSQERGIVSFGGRDLDWGPWEEALSYSLDASLGAERDSRQRIPIAMGVDPGSEGFK